MKKLKAYLASPYGFSESTNHFMRKVYLPKLSKVIIPLNPWDLTTKDEIIKAEKKGKLEAFMMEVGKRNKIAIDQSDIVIAALDGQEVESGTASEVGYAFGIGKKVYGYRTDFRPTGEKGTLITLQVQYFIEASGGKIFSNLDELIEHLKKNK